MMSWLAKDYIKKIQSIRLLFLLVFVGAFNVSYSQIDFEVFTPEFNSLNILAVSANVEDGYLFTGVVYPDSFLVLMKLDEDGSMLDSSHFYSGDNQRFFLDEIKETDNSYLLIGTSYNPIDTFPSLWIGEFSKDLVFQKEQLFAFPWNKNNRGIHYYWELESDTIYYASGYDVGWINIETSNMYWKDKRGQFGGYNQWTDIVPRKDSAGYLLTGWGLQYTDDSLNEIKTNPFWQATLGSGYAGVNAEYINDSTLFIASIYDCFASRELVQDGQLGLFVGVMDKDLNLLHHDTLSMSAGDDTAWGLHAPRLKLLARSSDTTFVVGGRTFPHHYNDSGIYFAKYNLNAERIWGGILNTDDDYQYHFTSILATPDGGCMLSGAKSDGTMAFQFYIFKVGPDGLVTGETSIPIDLLPINVYPNPTSDYITFDIDPLSDEMEIELINFDGQIVLRQKVNGKEEISTSHLPKGVYAYRLLSETGKVMYAGKMVKE